MINLLAELEILLTFTPPFSRIFDRNMVRRAPFKQEMLIRFQY